MPECWCEVVKLDVRNRGNFTVALFAIFKYYSNKLEYCKQTEKVCCKWNGPANPICKLFQVSNIHTHFAKSFWTFADSYIFNPEEWGEKGQDNTNFGDLCCPVHLFLHSTELKLSVLNQLACTLALLHRRYLVHTPICRYNFY